MVFNSPFFGEKMKYKFIILVLLLLAFVSCEKDEISSNKSSESFVISTFNSERNNSSISETSNYITNSEISSASSNSSEMCTFSSNETSSIGKETSNSIQFPWI